MARGQHRRTDRTTWERLTQLLAGRGTHRQQRTDGPTATRKPPTGPDEGRHGRRKPAA